MQMHSSSVGACFVPAEALAFLFCESLEQNFALELPLSGESGLWKPVV